jgi:hypothetical protein
MIHVVFGFTVLFFLTISFCFAISRKSGNGKPSDLAVSFFYLVLTLLVLIVAAIL